MDQFVELGLRRPSAPQQAPEPAAPPSPDSSASLRGFVERLLLLLSTLPENVDPNQVSDFREKVKDLQRQLAESTHLQEVRSVASSALKICEQYLRQAHTYWANRESEMAEMVAILREAAHSVVGSSEFHGQLLAGADRLSGLIRLDDIRELKNQLGREIAVMREAVKDKQRRDDETLAQLAKRVETLQAHLIVAEEEAAVDPLTKVANRRTFDRTLTRMIQTARATHAALSVAMIDIDHFKTINDGHGHTIGDRVLLCAAQWVTNGLRAGDFVARFGGEEFVALLPGVTLDAAERRFAEILQQIAARRFEYDADGVQKAVQFTVSCGIAQLHGNESEQDCVRRADQALYDAKRKGRNRVAIKKPSRFGGLLGG